MKKLTTLTEKMKNAIPAWNRQWIDFALKNNVTDTKTFEVNIKKLYSILGFKEVSIIWVKNPLVLQIANSIGLNILNNTRGAIVDSDVDFVIGSAVSSAVRSAVGSAVDSVVDSVVYSAVDSVVYSAVDSAVYSAVDSAVGSAVNSEVDSVVDSAVNSAVNSAVGSAVNSAVDSEVDSVVDSVVNSAVNSVVYSAVDSAVYSAVSSAVGSAVYSAVNSAVDYAVRSAVSSAVGAIRWHNWFGGHLWLSYQAWYEYYRQICGVSFDESISEKMEIYTALQKSAGYWIANKHWVMVCEKPEYISLNNSVLHNDKDMSIKYTDGWGLYHLNGVKVSKEIVETPAEKLNPELILNEQNADIQREIIRKIGAERVLKKLKAKELDTWTDSRTGSKYDLLQLKVGSIDRKYLYYEHYGLKGVFYAKPVPPECRKAMHARAWKDGIVERNELNSINTVKELEIEANMQCKAS